MGKILAEPLASVEEVGHRIHLVRGQKVMVDADLAEIYGLETKALNQAVRRNQARFPEDFMFQVTMQEAATLRSGSRLPKRCRGGRRYLPYVFTEYGAVMLASVLRTPVAVQASVRIARAFVRLRELLATNKGLAAKLAELERRITSHDAALGRHAAQIRVVFEAIRRLMAEPVKPAPRIGFRPTSA